MRITKIRVQNYKGYRDTGDIILDAQWNVVVGQNNAGKSAFLESFRLNSIQNKPHKSQQNERGVSPPDLTSIIFSAKFTGRELRVIVQNERTNLSLPVTKAIINDIPRFETSSYEEGLEISLKSIHSGNIHIPPDEKINDVKSDILDQSLYISPKDGPGFNISTNYNPNRSYNQLLSNYIFQKIYVFDAKRLSSGTCGFQNTDILSSDANNLAAVIAKLNLNPARLDQFEKHVTVIFPSIRGVRSAQGGSGLEVRIWPIDPKTQRDDLTIPLDECGTGVGQVLAILYVAINSENSCIAIDEPNSFLNPGALKKLINILKQYKSHQYIISTHSPEVIAALPEAKILSIKSNFGESHIETIEKSVSGYQRSILEEVGASTSDIFGTDRVVWVEGPTERDCFNLIYENEFNHRPLSFSVIPMRATGDFEGKEINAAAALDIYAALSEGGAMLPATIGFSFDRERRSAAQIDDLERRLEGLARVLPRMMIENYFIDTSAIHKLLVLRGFPDISINAIQDALISTLDDPKILPKGLTKDLKSIDTIKQIDGGRAIKAAIYSVTDNGYEYRKVQDGPFLLNYLIENDISQVEELISYAMGLMNR